MVKNKNLFSNTKRQLKIAEREKVCLRTLLRTDNQVVYKQRHKLDLSSNRHTRCPTRRHEILQLSPRIY